MNRTIRLVFAFSFNRVLYLVISLVITSVSWAHAQWVRVGLRDRDVKSVWASVDTLLAGGYGGWIHRSTDGGVNWTATSSNMHFRNVVSSFYDAGAFIYATADYSTFDTCDGCGGVYRSSDRGLTWQPTNAGFPTRGIGVTTLFQLGNRLYAGADLGLFISQTSNVFWVKVDSVFPEDFWILSSAVHDGKIFLGSLYDGVYFSSDSGLTWSARNTGLPRGIQNLYLSVSSFANLDTLVFASTDSGVYKTSDMGQGWRRRHNGVTELFADQLAATLGFLFLETSTRVYYYRSGDTVWSDFSQGLNFDQTSDITSLTSNTAYLYASAQGQLLGVWRRRLSDIVSVRETSLVGMPAKFSLDQNYPNPFNPTTTIGFHLPSSEEIVSLKVFDALGREVINLFTGSLRAGSYEITLDGSKLSSGMYVCRLAIRERRLSTKLLLIR